MGNLLNGRGTVLRPFIGQLLVTALAVMIFLCLFGRRESAAVLSALDGGFAVQDAQGNRYDVVYGDITELDLISLGEWGSKEEAEAVLCVDPAIDSAIRIKDKAGLLIFNFEGEESTRELFGEIREKLDERI